MRDARLRRHSRSVCRALRRGAIASPASRASWLPVTHRAETHLGPRRSDVTDPRRRDHHGPVIAGDPAHGTALVAALGAVRRARPVVRLPAADAARATVEDTVRRRPRLGPDRPQPRRRATPPAASATCVRAMVPVRPRTNGWLPVPGWTGEHEWNGLIPFEKMPAASIRPSGHRHRQQPRRWKTAQPLFWHRLHPPHRARRIWQRLAELSKATVEDMASIHRDTVSVIALEFRDRIRNLRSMARPRRCATASSTGTAT